MPGRRGAATVDASMGAIRRLPARMRALDPDRVDLGLALLAAVASICEALLLHAHGHSRASTAVFGVILSSTVAYRRRAPLLAPPVFAAALLLSIAFAGFLT